jgi:hypothetical protein
MTYFDFNFVTDPPADETVDEQTQLNENYEDLDLKLQGWNQKPCAIVGSPPVGTEGLDPQHPGDEYRIAVYDGTNWVRSLNHVSSWGAWSNLSLRAPAVERAGFTPRIRINEWTRQVQLSGGVLLNVAADPWPTGSDVEITADAAIANSFAPVPGGLSFFEAATSAVTAASSFAAALIRISTEAGPSRTSIKVRFQGDAGGGNFVMLDRLKWWY